MDFTYLRVRYFKGYVYHICLQDTVLNKLGEELIILSIADGVV